MMDSITSTGAITPEQKIAIERGLASGLSFETIRREVLEIGFVPDDDIRDEMERLGQIIELRRHFKKEGARLMREFVERLKSGSDVDDMAAMLELAIYRDLLRRYAEDDKALDRVSIEQLLKLDIRYRQVRVAWRRDVVNGKGSGAAKRISARLLPKIVDKLASMAGEQTAEEINSMRGKLMDWAKDEFGRENIEEIEKEEYEIQRLASFIGNGSCGDNPAEAGHGEADGLAG